MKRPGYMSIKEASETYGVSRSKVHRLIKKGRLRTAKDPRDERITLIPSEDLEAQFQSHASEPRYAQFPNPSGILTPEARARMDELRTRLYEKYGKSSDSTQIIREEREKRTRQLPTGTRSQPEILYQKRCNRHGSIQT